MRLSGLFVAAVLCFSLVLFVQHSSGASSSGHSTGSSGASSSGMSHGSFSGGSVSSTSSHSSSSSAPSAKSSSSKASASPQEKSSRSFFHPFRKPTPVQHAEFKTPTSCFKGSCGICPRGQSRGASGGCVLASNSCPSNQAWNGFACGTQGLFNDCSYLARQIADQKRLMQGQNDYGQSLRYRMLQDQYQQCLMHSRMGSGAYAFNSLFLLDTP
jgi:hypothetical protein